MKMQTLKKIIAMLMAAAVIFVALPFSSFSKAITVEELYSVTSAAPAVPMVKNTKVEFSSLQVQFEDGYVKGNELTWTLKNNSETGIRLTSAGIIANNVGAYLLVATKADGVTSTEVVVVVAETADGPFNIFDFDFTNTTAAKVNEVFGYQNYPSGSTTATVLDSELSADGIARKAGYALFVKDISIIGKFSDYTVSTVQKLAAKGYNNSGIIGRSLLTGAGLLDTTNNKSVAVSVARINGTTNTAFLTVGSGNKQYIYSTNTTVNTAYELNPPVKSDEFQEVAVKFSGNDFVLYLGDENNVLTKVYSLQEDTVILPAQKNVRYPSRSGATVGLSGINTVVYHKNLTVSIPISSMPVATEVASAYSIDTAFPVLPMVKNTQVAVEDLKVQLADGSYKYGDEFNWTEAKEYEEISIQNGVISAFETSGYLLKATLPTTNEVVEVVVSVAETANGPFNIFDFDFTNTTAAKVNEVFGYQNYPSSSTTATVLDSELSADGIARKAGYALFVKDISIIGKFSDYTVSTVQKLAARGYNNSGIMGRSLLTSAGLLDTTNNKSVAVSVAKINGVTNTAYLTVGSSNKQYIYTSSGAYNASYDLNPPVKSDEFQEVAVKFSGNDFVLYLGDENNVLTKVYSLQEDTVITSAQKTMRYPSRSGATVGLSGINTVVYHKNLTVSIPVDTNNLPNMISIATSNEITVLKNSVVNISRAFGVDSFAAYRDEIGEVSDNMFVAYSEGTVYVSDKSGEKYTITVTGDASKVTVEGTTFAPEYITVVPSNDKATLYTANVTLANGKAIDGGVIKVRENSFNGDVAAEQELIYTTDINADKYQFEVLYAHLMSISCDIVDDSVPFINSLGATAHLPISSANYYGIKFVSRVSLIRASNAEGTAASADTIIIDGSEYPIIAAGTVLLPTVLIPQGTELTVDTPDASVTYTNKVAAVTNKHSDVAVKLTGIPESFLDTDVTARVFVQYNKGTDEAPEYAYFYGDQLTRSYNSVLKVAYPAIDKTEAKVDEFVDGGSNYALDNDATTDDISYKVGEDITFALRIKGNYYVESYSVSYDYSDGVTPARVVNNSNANITNMFKYTTSMDGAGIVTLKLKLFGKINDNLNATNQVVKTVVMAVAVNLEEINNEDYLADDIAVAAYLSGAATTWENSDEMATLKANFSGVKEFLDSGEDSYEVPNVIKLTKTDKSTSSYYVYEYIIATDASRGLETTNADGYFEYSEVNERPATGYITIPVSGISGAINGIYAFYMGWANSASSSTAYANGSRICIYPNAHACLNGQADQYYANLGSISNEGYSSSDYKYNSATGKHDLKAGAQKVTIDGKAVYGDYRFMFETDDDVTAANDLFDYGLIKRNYFALQLAKAVAPENSTIENYGGSMGGWQSVLMAAIEPKVKKLTAVMPWKCTLGSDKDGLHINATFMPTYSDIRMNFNTVSAIKMLSSDVDVRVLCGLADETAPVIGAIALYNAAPVTNKEMTLTQYQTHSGYQTTVLTQSTRTTK